MRQNAGGHGDGRRCDTYGDRTRAAHALRADGSQTSIEFTVTRVHDEADGLVVIRDIIRDVSERREQDRARRAHVAEPQRELAELRR
jgi:hypothetical protein